MSVPSFCEVRLDIVRPGRQHNQLLSPLTPYMALCGEGSPITFNVDFEHQQLLTRLERLRYVTKSSAQQKFVSIPTRMREAEVGEIGSEIARLLRKIETLSTELARAQGNNGSGLSDSMTIVHLRIVLSGSELALLPFEMAIAPLAYPGEGLEFCLQASLPIVVTREVRRGQPIPVKWSQTSEVRPKVLIVYAEPEGMKVPARAHIQAIRASLEPWIRHVSEADRTGDPAQDEHMRLEFVKKRLRVVANASIDSIYKMCAEEEFTHIHILAHGDTYEHAGVTHFGVALCSNDGTQAKEVVSGKRLAKALQAERALGSGRSEPLVVTLATCDSGNQADVLIPGGSIAHDLHVEGIPWVFASQFPLTVSGSVRMAEALYPRLFRGDDPRQILFELRRQLYEGTQNDHDWASVVAYAALPRDFNTQVADFSSRQIKAAINVSLDHADSISNRAEMKREEVEKAIENVEDWLKTWRGREPKGKSAEDRLRRSEIIGMHGTTYKRIALLMDKVDKGEKVENGRLSSQESRLAAAADGTRKTGDRATKNKYYRRALEYYRAAMKEASATGMSYYWTATQYLSLQAILGGERDEQTYDLARRLAMLDTDSEENDSTKAWAHGTLAELELLRAYHYPLPDGSRADIEKSLKEHCEKIVRLKGHRSFHVGSTLRQFRRYIDFWDDQRWHDYAQYAIDILGQGTTDLEFDYPEDE